MINCQSCGATFGELGDFGFLVCQEKNGGTSYHFVADTKFTQALEDDHLVIEKDFLKGQYYLANCKHCASSVAKKFKTRGKTYIAFGKEKITYNGHKLKKTDTWLPLISSEHFSMFQKFSINDFTDGRKKGGVNPENKSAARLPRNMPVPASSKASWGQPREGPPAPKQAGPHGPPRDAFQPAQGYAGRGGGGRAAESRQSDPKRPKVGMSLSERVVYLQQKRNNWEASKFIHEFCGPNNENWTEIINGLAADIEGTLMREVFKLLSHRDIAADTRSADLCIPLTNPTGIMGMFNYLSTGPLSGNNVTSAVQTGRGGPSWIKAMDDAIDAVETIAILMTKFVAFSSNSMVTSLVESLSNRITILLGPSYEDSSTIDSWVSNASQKNKSLGDAKHLSNKLDYIKSVQKASNDSNLKSVKNKSAADKEEKESTRLAMQRARKGVKFLDDPERDGDYKSVRVIPESDELVSDAPAALPLNLVCRGASDRDEYDPDLRIVNAPQYRSIDHYINTHYLLIREDSIAQLRRGISTLRNLLGATSAADISSPKPDFLRLKCADFARHRGNSGAYIYGDVTVRSVEKMRDDIGYIVTFSMFDRRKVDWANSQRFMKGSLLCLSSDGTFNSRTLVMATVMRGVDPPQSKCVQFLLFS